MLKVRIIPCLDVNNGRVVKGVKFQNLRDAGSPIELARHYEEQGADELVVLDVSATREARLAMLETIESVRRQLSIPLTVGGGVGSVEDAARLLNAGADKVSINSAAVRNPDLIDQMAQRFGAQCTVVAIDAKLNEGLFQVLTRSGTTWIQQAKLTASDGAAGDWFGWSVAISGDTVAIGAHFDDDNGIDFGSAYIFERTAGGPDNWGEVTKLNSADGAEGD